MVCVRDAEKRMPRRPGNGRPGPASVHKVKCTADTFDARIKETWLVKTKDFKAKASFVSGYWSIQRIAIYLVHDDAKRSLTAHCMESPPCGPKNTAHGGTFPLSPLIPANSRDLLRLFSVVLADFRDLPPVSTITRRPYPCSPWSP